MTDARIVRTRASLHAAVLQLAAEKPVTDVSVSELADAADINRVTFYKHYASPAEALHAALVNDLELARAMMCPLRERPSCDPTDDFVATVALILDHIERNRAIYTLSFRDRAEGVAANVLAQHFTDTVRFYLDARMLVQPTPPAFKPDLLASMIGCGIVGPVSQWMNNEDYDRADILDALYVLSPAWWFAEEAAARQTAELAQRTNLAEMSFTHTAV